MIFESIIDIYKNVYRMVSWNMLNIKFIIKFNRFDEMK